MGVDLPQSVPLLLLFAAAGGVVEVLATAVLARQDERAKEGYIISKWRYRGALAINTTLQVTASVLGNLFAPWFGPVSLVAPMFLSAQLVANMIIFGFLLGLESFTKDMKTGTYIIVVAALLLPEVGPQAQEDQDVASLIGTWYSILWICVMVFAMVASSTLLNGWNIKALQQKYRIIIILVARSTSFAINLTVSRVMVLSPNVAYLSVSIVLKILSGAVMTHAIIVQSTAVSQAVYVPLNACTLIAVNAITGIVVWEDHPTVGSWLGYACVFVLLLLGSYLLLGDFELFAADNAAYGVAGSWRAMRNWHGKKIKQVRRTSMRVMGRGGDDVSVARKGVVAASKDCAELRLAQRKLAMKTATKSSSLKLPPPPPPPPLPTISPQHHPPVPTLPTQLPTPPASSIEVIVDNGGGCSAGVGVSAPATDAAADVELGTIAPHADDSEANAAATAPMPAGSPPHLDTNLPHATDVSATAGPTEDRHRLAWASVYGLTDAVHEAGHHYRERNIFAIDHYYNRSGECVQVDHTTLQIPPLDRVLPPLIARFPAALLGMDRASALAEAATTGVASSVADAATGAVATASQSLPPFRPRTRQVVDDRLAASAPTSPTINSSAAVAAAAGRRKSDLAADSNSVGSGWMVAPANRSGKLKRSFSTPSGAGGGSLHSRAALEATAGWERNEDDDGGDHNQQQYQYQPRGLQEETFDGDVVASSSVHPLSPRNRSDTEQTGSTAGTDTVAMAAAAAAAGATTVSGTMDPRSATRDGELFWLDAEALRKAEEEVEDDELMAPTRATTLAAAPSFSPRAGQPLRGVPFEHGIGSDVALGGDSLAAAIAAVPAAVPAPESIANTSMAYEDESRDFRRICSHRTWLIIALGLAAVVSTSSAIVLMRFREPDNVLMRNDGKGKISSSSNNKSSAKEKAEADVFRAERVRRGYESIKAASAVTMSPGGAPREWPDNPNDLRVVVSSDSPERQEAEVPARYRAAVYVLFDDPTPLAPNPESDPWFLQRYALRSVWEAMGGERWYVPWDWTKSGEAGAACDFFGARCDPTRSYVTELLLSSNGLDTMRSTITTTTTTTTSSTSGRADESSTIIVEEGVPDELSLLRELTTLHLDGNPRLGGAIPSRALRSLRKLQNVSFRSCGLKGPIPRDLFEGLAGLAEGEGDGGDGGAIEGGAGRGALQFLSLEENDALEGPVPLEACNASVTETATPPVLVVNCRQNPCSCCRGPYCE